MPFFDRMSSVCSMSSTRMRLSASLARSPSAPAALAASPPQPATLAELPENTEKIDAYIARRLSDPKDRDSVRKIGAALFRRGYSWEEIRAALRRFDTETEED